VCWQGGIFVSGAQGSLSSLTGQQMRKRVQAPPLPRAARFALLTPNFTNLTFLETLGVNKLFVFLSIFGFFGVWCIFSNIVWQPIEE